MLQLPYYEERAALLKMWFMFNIVVITPSLAFYMFSNLMIVE